ncbi:MAG: adenosylhomocysteinase, partial [Bacillota bacterium]
SSIKHPELAEKGHKKIKWVSDNMDILQEIKKEYIEQNPLSGIKVSICLHLEAKTAYMAALIKELGAEVAICGSNPLSTQDDVAAALAEKGVEVHSWYNADDDEYRNHIQKVLSIKPDLIIDDGGDLVETIHSKNRELINNIIGGAEETTTGVTRLKALEADSALSFPMIAVNDAYCKYLFDNRYGTGQSVWDGIMRTTNLVVAGKTVVVAGYGWCGKGVARRAKGLGARVVVTEIDPIKASEAWMDGFRVMPMEKAAEIGDIFITVTGCNDVITRKHFEKMKNGALLANAGHFDIEVSKNDLEQMATEIEIARENIKRYVLPGGKELYLLAEGRLVNLAAADGHPAEIMDMSFALQILSLLHLKENSGLKNKVHQVPGEIDQKVARLKLNSLGIEIDTLSDEQKEYLSKWQY